MQLIEDLKHPQFPTLPDSSDLALMDFFLFGKYKLEKILSNYEWRCEVDGYQAFWMRI